MNHLVGKIQMVVDNDKVKLITDSYKPLIDI